jgi:hypothetical protein
MIVHTRIIADAVAGVERSDLPDLFLLGSGG